MQYNRDYAWDKLQPAPYPAKVGNPTPRITDETAAVKFLKPDDPLLNQPNKITQADFEGWVQERGLYFWSEFDSKYTPLLAMHDPGESNLNGGLVYTRFGKGIYIYTGLAFFRELPEGVPGAYRLFVNLLSASKTISSASSTAGRDKPTRHSRCAHQRIALCFSCPVQHSNQCEVVPDIFWQRWKIAIATLREAK